MFTSHQLQLDSLLPNFINADRNAGILKEIPPDEIGVLPPALLVTF